MFGRKKVKPEKPTGAGTSLTLNEPQQEPAPNFPWAREQSATACNFAAGNLANNLAQRVTINGRVHAETYVAASGAIAGFAAQHSFLATADKLALEQMQMATTESGDKYLFGEPLNNMLVATAEAEGRSRVWSVAAGAAVSAGMPMDRLPNLGEMFGHVSSQIGEMQGFLHSVAENYRPQVPVVDLLRHVWPMAAHFFAADFDELHRRHGPVPREWWGPVAAYVSGRPITEVKDVLEPAVALAILMETAIYTSKVDRARIEQV